MKSAEAAEIVGDLASQQWGLVTSAQAKAAGVDLPSLRRLTNHGVLVRIRHGVYATTATALSAELELKAQWLALQPELMAADRTTNGEFASTAVVSHETAADLWGIGDLWPDGAHFTVADRRQSRQPDVHFHRAALGDTDWTVHPDAGLPVTMVSRTIADLARAGHEPGHLLDMVADAARKRLVDEDELLERLDGLEAAFGVDAGDRDGMAELLAEYFPDEQADKRTLSLFSEALRPLQEQVAGLSSALAPQLAWNRDLRDALDLPLRDSITSLQNPLGPITSELTPDLYKIATEASGFGDLLKEVNSLHSSARLELPLTNGPANPNAAIADRSIRKKDSTNDDPPSTRESAEDPGKDEGGEHQ